MERKYRPTFNRQRHRRHERNFIWKNEFSVLFCFFLNSHWRKTDFLSLWISLFIENIYATLPRTQRGQPIVLGGDPKGKHFLYCNGNSVIIRNIDVSVYVFIIFMHMTATWYPISSRRLHAKFRANNCCVHSSRIIYNEKKICVFF